LKSTNTKIISLNYLQNGNSDLVIDAIIEFNLSGELTGKLFDLIK